MKFVAAGADPSMIAECREFQHPLQVGYALGRVELTSEKLAMLGDLYDANTGINTEVLNLTAEEDRVVAEVCIRGRSAHSGEPYENLYVFLFWIRDSVFREVHEHLDTAYAERVLLKPAGIESGADMPWLEDSGDTCD